MINLGTNHAPSGLPQAVASPPLIKRESRPGEGRPTVMTKDVLRKLEDAFAFCYTDEEACLYAGIGKTALYEYQKDHPEFTERKETLRLTPNLMAKKQLVEAIKGSTGQSRWWAAHKMGKEFALNSKIELGGRIETADVTTTEAMRKVALEFEEKLKGAIAAGVKKAP